MEAGDTEPDAGRLGFDVFSAIVLFLTAILGAWLPMHLSGTSDNHQGHSWRSGKTWYHLGNCLSAGVMLSAGFCHLLADSLHGIAFVGRFPMANFLAAVGFLVTLAADQLVQVLSGEPSACHGTPTRSRTLRRQHSRRNRQVELTDTRLSGGGSKQAAGEKAPLLEVGSTGSKPQVPPLAPSHSVRSVHARQTGTGADGDDSRAEEQAFLGNGTGQHTISLSGWEGGEVDSKGGGLGRGLGQLVVGPAGSEASDSEAEEGAGHLEVLLSPGMKKLNFATALLLAAALCVHSVLEGMALGAQKTMASTEDIMLAIAAHKGLAAYALGSSIVESGASAKRCWIVMLTFSLATPLAIFIGYALSVVDSGKGGDALSALAAGTFLYVAIMEVIPRELQSAHALAAPNWVKAAKITALTLGFGAMSLLAIWA